MDRLVRVRINAAEQIDYTYDSVGNRLSMISNGVDYDPPAITDSGDYSLDNTKLDIQVGVFEQMHREYLTYGFSFGDRDLRQ
ncbi:MAG: hypothetical protein U5R30_15285 [Deltaproteobacteria bacterium]|nr:hypothetical protein [Deltaproteobacteria bacterium]